MKIEHNGYTYHGKEQIERAMARQSDLIEVQKAQLNLVQQWVREQLKIHQPYTHQLDVSCVEPENMATELARRIQKDLWCARCSNPWPCRYIPQLRLLRDASRRNDMDSLKVIAEAMEAIPAPAPARRDGQIDVGL